MKNSTWQVAPILVVLLLILAGCAGRDPTPTPAPATVVAEASETVEAVQSEVALANTSWQAESFGGPDDRVPVLPDTYPSLHFMVERYSGYTGCNWFLGVFEVEGSAMTIYTPAETVGGCDMDGVAEQGATYMVSLENVTHYELADDKLHLYTVEDQLLVTLVPLESLPFEGTTWEAKFFSTEPAYWQPHLPDTLITAQFDGEQMTGNAGCNDYSASYTRSDDQLTLSELSVTEKTCSEPEGVMDQEELYLSMLAEVSGIIEAGRSIELLADDALPLLLYHGE